MIGTMDGDDERNPPTNSGLRWPQGRLRWINGVTASVVAFAIGAVLLAGGSYGFAQHSTPRPFQAVNWPDGLCIACLIIGLIFLGLLVMQTMMRTSARRCRVRHIGR
jgi:TRAP-type C4-dicarboxylate transport system permease small subunit